MSIIIPANSAVGGGFEVANSARFETNTYMTKTASSGNTKTFTISFWTKRSALGAVASGSNQFPISFYQNGDNRISFAFLTDNTFIVYAAVGGADKMNFTTNRVFRDTSAWYHVVIKVDTTQGTEANRFKMYINGVQETSFSTATYPSQNDDLTINTNIYVGTYDTTNNYYHGYLAEFVYIDGTAYDPTSFGEFDEDSGVWKAIDVSGLTFETNSFYLNFENSGALGADVSGESNNFTVNNLTTVDQTTDTCTNNFATVNSLDNFYEASTFSEGNCKIVTEASLYSYNTSTIGLTQGKWYCEVYIETSPHPSTKDSMIGIAGRMTEGNDNFLGQSSDTYGIYGGSGKIFNNGSPTSYGVTQTTNDIVGIYMDLDNNKLYFAKNGALMNSGTGFNLLASNLTTAGAYFMVAADYGNGYQGTYRLNFGNPIYALSSANTDVNGYGSFEYDPSSGTFDGASKDFLAICTKNLSEVNS